MVEDAIESAKKLMDLMNYNPREYYGSLFYLITNENLNGYYDYLDICGKDVLTVTSSGDQYLMAMLYEPNQIDTFDINPNAKYLLYLKFIALLNLSLEDYRDYFTGKLKKEEIFIGNSSMNRKKRIYLDENIYEKFSKYLPLDIKCFWDTIYGSGKDICTYFYSVGTEVTRLPAFFEKEKYIKLQNILETRNFPFFYDLDIKDILTKIKNKYDVIITSNISDYYKSNILSWTMFVNLILCKMLKEKGIIQLDYSWINGYTTYVGGGVQKILFDPIEVDNKVSYKDSVLIYKK